MVSIIGLDSVKVQELCDAANEEVDEANKVQIANFLCTVSLFMLCSYRKKIVYAGSHTGIQILVYTRGMTMGQIRLGFRTPQPIPIPIGGLGIHILPKCSITIY